jgi:hypothetical protein
MNTANEVTALGARVAIVCDMNDDRIYQRMAQVMPMLKQADFTISYYPATCTAAGGDNSKPCESVTVSIAPNMKIDTVTPFMPLSIKLPQFSTTQTREAMDSAGCA